jgi:hypothetical protein
LRRVFDPVRDELVLATSKYSGEGHPTLGSIFSIYRQTKDNDANRFVSWNPVNIDITKYGFSYDTRGFFAGLTGPLAVDLEGRMFLAPQVECTAFSANRISRTTILRVDEPTRKLVAMIYLERS